jgi:UrcA family protein
MVRLAVAFALAAAASPALAGGRHELIMARVPVGDLDLKTPAGAAAMLQRLGAAATELCAPSVRSAALPYAERQAWLCRREAVAAAVQRLKSPDLALAWARQLSAAPTASP